MFCAVTWMLCGAKACELSVAGVVWRRLAICGMVLSSLVLTSGSVVAHGPVSVADIAQELQGAVVNIATSQTLKSAQGVPLPEIPEDSPLGEYFDDLFDDQEQVQRKVSSLGSGFVIDESGIIVTNYHVIEAAEEIIVNFNDGTELKVDKILGRDTETDLALLKVTPTKPLKAVKFGSSNRMRVGDWVMAIGNPFGLGGSVTVGIISAKERDIHAGPYDDFIQTDAAINRGNSGGPLFDLDGRVIGINTAIISPTGGSIGIGFAVPSDTAAPIIDQLKEYGEVRRGWLGLYIRSVSEAMQSKLGLKDRTGALVANIQGESPAAKADMKAGDVIVRFDGKPIVSKRSLTRIVASTKVGKTVEVEYLRKGRLERVKVTVGLLPDNVSKVTPARITDNDAEGARPLSAMLGLDLSVITDGLRKRFEIGRQVKGVVITKVAPGSTAAQKDIVAGDVIVEVAKQEVRAPADVAKRIREVMRTEKKVTKILLLLSDGKGALRFVAVPVKKG